MDNKLSTYKLVCVIWDDAHMSLDEYTQDELKRDIHRAEKVYSFGLLVMDDDKGVTLATDEGSTDGKFRKVNFIPRGMIVEQIDLGIPKRKGERKRREKIVVDTVPSDHDN